jgi:hypothetical protein
MYTALLKRIVNKTLMLKVLLEALEALKLLGPLRGFRAKDVYYFLGGIRMNILLSLIIK